MPLFQRGQQCAHCKFNEPEKLCGATLDVFGDHAVTCNVGGFVQARHAAVNGILARAGREAGYTALLEQVVPELGRRTRKRNGRIVYEEARLDVELFGHAFLPDLLLDATVRHPGALHILPKAAKAVCAAAHDGVDTKSKRYPPVGGKIVTPCAIETWGRIHSTVGDLLDGLAVHASQRQRDRGVHATNWQRQWRTLLSIHMALAVAKPILATTACAERPCVVLLIE